MSIAGAVQLFDGVEFLSLERRSSDCVTPDHLVQLGCEGWKLIGHRIDELTGNNVFIFSRIKR